MSTQSCELLEGAYHPACVVCGKSISRNHPISICFRCSEDILVLEKDDGSKMFMLKDGTVLNEKGNKF